MLTFSCVFRALKAGMQRPLLVCPAHKDYKNSTLVAALGALHALYMVRNTFPSSLRRQDTSAGGVWKFVSLSVAKCQISSYIVELYEGREVESNHNWSLKMHWRHILMAVVN